MLTQILSYQQHKIISRILLNHPSLTAKKTFFLIRNTTLDTKTGLSQYKVLYNTGHVNKIIFKFGKVVSSRCSFYKLHDETTMYLFCDYLIVKRIWKQLKSVLSNNLNFLISTPQSAIFGFSDLHTNKYFTLNHLLLIFKIYINNARATSYLNINHLLVPVKVMKHTEKKLCENDAKRRKKTQ